MQALRTLISNMVCVGAGGAGRIKCLVILAPPGLCQPCVARDFGDEVGSVQ